MIHKIIVSIIIIMFYIPSVFYAAASSALLALPDKREFYHYECSAKYFKNSSVFDQYKIPQFSKSHSSI